MIYCGESLFSWLSQSVHRSLACLLCWPDTLLSTGQRNRKEGDCDLDLKTLIIEMRMYIQVNRKTEISVGETVVQGTMGSPN